MAKAKEESHPIRLNAIEERIRVNLVRFVADSGYNQTQVADLSGIPQSGVARYMKGENAIPAAALESLAQVFGRAIDDFYKMDPPPAPKNLREPILKSRPGAELTAEDLEEWKEYLARFRSRREKKGISNK